MKYFLIAGEASGDLHAAHLMAALRRKDPEASFRFYGGDHMSAVGGMRLRHYRHLAYMGFIPVLLHLPQILKGMARCKRDIETWQPDVVVLVDYPGFNLNIAKFVSQKRICPVYYYISPKIWAWKEHRIHSIRRHVARLYSILPFEVDFFERKHGYKICYVGNPTVDEVAAFRKNHAESREAFAEAVGIDPERPIIALLAGSRRQEIKDNLLRMCLAAAPFVQEGYQLVLAGAPSISQACYEKLLARLPDDVARPTLVEGKTYRLLAQAEAALVTSGTATLETALFGVPQVVCYYTACGRLVSWMRRRWLKVKHISLVNLVCDAPVVPELVADGMTVPAVRSALGEILPGGTAREPMLEGYRQMTERLGTPGAPERAAADMVERLRSGEDRPHAS